MRLVATFKISSVLVFTFSKLEGLNGVPVINIGSRQERRLRGKNTFEVKKHSSKDIFSAVKKINKSGKIKSSYVYGNGDSGKKVSDVLEKVELKFKKTITY